MIVVNICFITFVFFLMMLYYHFVHVNAMSFLYKIIKMLIYRRILVFLDLTNEIKKIKIKPQ